ncbi:MAG: TIGR03862 family flavoprotein [Vicingaceae bacterium]|nr:TIGR03862 family flavoprotein [Vicingaceae bacterium]
MKKTVAIIGGGPAALLLAAHLDEKKYTVTIYEKNATLGRKFLVAGKGGFNLTHSEPIEEFIKRYTPPSFLKDALTGFNNQDLRDWLDSIGIPTFIGSSKRIYPEKGIKPIEVLTAILNVLDKKGVVINYNYTWRGWSDTNEPIFNTGTSIKADYTVFALGGGSWKVTGSDGSWLKPFKQKEIEIKPFKASNCGYQINWTKQFIRKHEGSPIKNIAITCLNQQQKGEVVVTKFGLEGNAIYALSPKIREALTSKQKASIALDLKPALTIEKVLNKLKSSSLKNTTDTLKVHLKLSPVQIGLLKSITSKEEFINLESLSHNIKNLELEVVGTSPVEEAISTVGGISLNAVDNNFELNKLPNTYCIGEMLDYDAPTGGYLLQSCFSMGVYLAKYLNKQI